MKLTPDEWLQTPKYLGIIVMDPDGWDRANFLEDWAIPLTEKEFGVKLSICTNSYPAGYFEGR